MVECFAMQLNPVEKLVFFFVFFHVLLAVFFSHINPSYFLGPFIAEGGLIESLTAEALLGAVILSIYRIVKLRTHRPLLFLLFLGLVAGVFLFGFGEELSWGQRIFGFQSPHFFVENNSQGETTIHNFVFRGKRINKLVFGLSLGIFITIYSIPLPIFYRISSRVRRFVDTIGLPIPKLFHILLYLVLVICHELIPSSRRGEILEFGGAWIFLMMIWFPQNSHVFQVDQPLKEATES